MSSHQSMRTPSAAELALADRLVEINLEKGWLPDQYRIVPLNGGFAVEKLYPTYDEAGDPEWVQVCWTRDKEDAERMRNRRLGRLVVDLSSGDRREIVRQFIK